MMIPNSPTNQGVHPFTLDWWRELPEEFRKADRAQGEVQSGAWDGLNRDPRFITGFDGWDRTNTSVGPWTAALTFSRTFDVTPGAKVLVRSWHTPKHETGGPVEPIEVRHAVKDYTGKTVKSTTVTVLEERTPVDTWVVPDRVGRIHVTVEARLPVPVGVDAVEAVHVGAREVTFEDLPGYAHFTVHRPYPLLRYMDGIGHQLGYIRAEAARMWRGDTVNPATAPDAWLPFLASVLGIPSTYVARLTMTQLRSHLIALVEEGRPPIGSRRALAEIAKQWLTGGKQVTVLPGHAAPSWPTPEDKALLTAVTGAGDRGRVIISTGTPVPEVEYQWTGTPNGSISHMRRAGQIVAENRAVNPAFHEGLNSWSATRANAERDTSRFEVGVASMKVTPTGETWYAITNQQVMPFRGYITARFRVYSDTPRSLQAKVWTYDPAGSTTGERTLVEAGSWTTVTVRGLVEEGQMFRVSVGATAGESGMGPVWVDSALVARGTYLSDAYFDGSTADSTAADVWVKPGATPAVSVWDPATGWKPATGNHTAAANAAIAADKRGDRTHTLLMMVRTDELPGRDLAAFQAFMMRAGVVPAGHRLVCLEARTTWDQWEATVGEAWADVEARARTWTADEAAGVTLDF